jgi:penicillin-binding protein 1A
VTEENKQKTISTRSMRYMRISFILLLASGFVGVASVAGLYFYLSPQLPDIQSLREVKLQVPLKIYSQDDLLIAQFGEKKRTPVAISDTPKQLTNAFISAEDDRFYEHPGVDYHGLIRAAIQLAISGKKRQGGSTITMQVARNFFLTKEKTFTRKFKEIFLALKIENELSKDEILELYLNKIYLGHRSYGIGAASQTYYGRDLNALSLSQLAMIAGLPKAPSRYNPVTNPERAKTRRNYVLGRMLSLEHISKKEYDLAIEQPVTAQLHRSEIELKAPHIAEMVRAEMVLRYGNSAYTAGYIVKTTLLSKNQTAANQSLQDTLHAYDKRHGYRGATSIATNFSIDADLAIYDEILANVTPLKNAQAAVVISLEEQSALVYLNNRETATVEWPGLEWARKATKNNRLGPRPKLATNILKPGDIIYIRKNSSGALELSQRPLAEGAFVALNPQSGAIEALVGGYDFSTSKYNRVIQSKRQPGSGFKPILYTTALENGYTLATLINDAPIVFDDPALESEWRPENYSGKFFGPTRLRVALRNSRNLVSIRILRDLGTKKVITSAQRFGLSKEQLPNNLSLALGSGHATPLNMARVYSAFANGGFLISPYFIDEIRNREGEILFKSSPEIACNQCDSEKLVLAPQTETKTLDEAPILAKRIISPEVHYLMNSLLKDVVKRGTARRALTLGRSDLAGKTGTTNDQRDAWFNGYNPEQVAIAWVGFDSSQPLGSRETGGRAALPMWIAYMKEVLAGKSEITFEQPEGITSILINPATGLLAKPSDKKAIFEYFRIENSPTEFSEDEQESMSGPYTDNNESENSEDNSLF